MTPATRGTGRLAVVAVVAVAAAFALAATAAAAAPGTVTFTQKGVSGDAFWESCTTQRGLTTCVDTYLFAFQGTEKSSDTGTFKGTHVCLYVDTYSFRSRGGGPGGGESFESGCTDAAAGTLTVANDLSSATLGSTAVTLDTYECTGEEECTIVSSRQATIAASWTGTGPLFKNSGRFKFSDGSCTETDSFRSTGREATVAGTLDGASLGTGYGFLNDGSFTFKTDCSYY